MAGSPQYHVTTADDIAMGHPSLTVNAATPEEAAHSLALHAADYYDAETAEQHVGTPISVIVTDDHGNESKFTRRFS